MHGNHSTNGHTPEGWTDDGYLDDLWRDAGQSPPSFPCRFPQSALTEDIKTSHGGNTENTGNQENTVTQPKEQHTNLPGGMSPCVAPQDSAQFLDLAFAAALADPAPEAARYLVPPMRLLVSLCRVLQRAAGDRPFYLACREAGRLLGVTHPQAAKYIRRLLHDGVLLGGSVKGRDHGLLIGTDKNMKASQYRYTGA